MKFTHILSALLATLVVATPRDDHRREVAARAPNADLVAELAARLSAGDGDAPATLPLAIRAPKIEDTAEYSAANKAHSPLAKGKYYWFYLQWKRGTVGDGDGESAQELKELRDRLGFDHVGIVVGVIEETTRGKGKNEVLKRNFNAEIHHLIEVQGSDKAGVIQRRFDGKKDSTADKVLVYGGETTASKASAAKKFAKAWTDDNAKKTYNIKTNNCDTFAQAVKGKL